jgi:predicted nuclease with TOPRIM domain
VDDKVQVQVRLQALRKEFEAGQKQLAEVEAQRSQLMETMLRISGAIQVLEELAGERAPEGDPQPNGSQEPGAAELATAGG